MTAVQSFSDQTWRPPAPHVTRLPVGDRNCEDGFGRSCGPATVGVWDGQRMAAYCRRHAEARDIKEPGGA